jgi:hypothetical protein
MRFYFLYKFLLTFSKIEMPNIKKHRFPVFLFIKLKISFHRMISYKTFEKFADTVLRKYLAVCHNVWSPQYLLRKIYLIALLIIRKHKR